MKMATCRVLCVGEISAGAKQFLGALQANQLIEVAYEPSLQKFCDGAPSNRLQVLLVEAIARAVDARRERALQVVVFGVA